MQASRFHNLLGKLIVEHRANRMTVCVNKDSFKHALESDGAVILEVAGIEIRTYPMLDDDGGIKELKDGTESQRTSIVIYGDGYQADTEVKHGP